MVDKDLRHHEIGNNNGDDHRIILVDGVDAFEISVGELYVSKASRVCLLAFVGVGVHGFVGDTSTSLSFLCLIPSSISISTLVMVLMVPPRPASNLIVIRLFYKLG